MSQPTRMRAVTIPEPGGPDALMPSEVDTPEPRTGEILIKVAAAGVNRPDVMQRTGAYPVPSDASPLPGLEVAGEIVAVGEDVHRWQVGDKVTALTHGGGYAEYCVAHETHALPWPEGYDAVKAAALPETYFTVYYNLFMRARLQAGERVLIHGGSSGIGTTAIQLANAFGAKVATTAGSEEKCAMCRKLGADLAIDYKKQDFYEEVRAWAKAEGGQGVNVVLDMVGGDYVNRNLRLLERDGRYAFIAFLGGSKAEVDFAQVLGKRLTVSGSTLRPQTVEEKGNIARELELHVWPLLSGGKVAPVIHETFALEKAADAHRLMESSTHIGKILLIP